jgi:hypothetical protein
MGSGRRPVKSLRIRGKEKKMEKYSSPVYRLVQRRRPKEMISLYRDNNSENMTTENPVFPFSTQYMPRKPCYKIHEAFKRIIWCNVFREIIV